MIFRGTEVDTDRALRIFRAVDECGRSLASLQPETRLMVLTALCSVYLTDEPATQAPRKDSEDK